MSDYLNPDKIQTEYGIAPGTVEEAIKSGKLPAAIMGRAKLIERTDLEHWIKQVKDEQMAQRRVSHG